MILKRKFRKSFLDKYNLKEFVLCAGRKEKGKNTDLLVNYFTRFLKNNNSDLKLLLTGSGEINIPPQFSKNIITTFLTRQELYEAYGAAIVLCLPSVNESFSRVIMESWLCSTSVLVHDKCKVTTHHCIQSNGGLYFQNYDEFEACLKYFLEHSEIRKKMGENGKKYVLENFSWDKVINNYSNFISKIF